MYTGNAQCAWNAQFRESSEQPDLACFGVSRIQLSKLNLSYTLLAYVISVHTLMKSLYNYLVGINNRQELQHFYSLAQLAGSRSTALLDFVSYGR